MVIYVSLIVTKKTTINTTSMGSITWTWLSPLVNKAKKHALSAEDIQNSSLNLTLRQKGADLAKNYND